MSWEQKAAMQDYGEISSFKKVKPGVRKGCVLFPDLSSLCSEIFMGHLERYPGI